MRLRQAVARSRDAEIAILRVGAQAVGLEILFAVMADGDALFRALRGFCALARRAPSVFFRAVGLATVLLAAAFRAGDFFNAAALAAAREVGFFLAIAMLPFRMVGKG